MKKTNLVSAMLLSSLGFIAAVGAADGTAKPESRKPWVYQPVERPAIPAVENTKWVRTPIDAFVLANLEAVKLAPSKEADRATFIRRATLDIWGLLPTPEEVHAFEKDRSKDAYEKLVANEVDYVPMTAVQGRIAATLALIYPPGIGVIVPGERWDERARPMLEYFNAFEESFNRFPGFSYEVQGVYQETIDGRIKFHTYVVRPD